MRTFALRKGSPSLVNGLQAWRVVRARKCVWRFLSSGQWAITNAIDGFSTVPGRIGVLMAPPPSPTAVARRTTSINHLGWTIGGAEGVRAANAMLKAEDLYVDLGESTYALKSTAALGNPTPWVGTFEQDLSVCIGANDRFSAF